ncbi:MAG: type I-E CRISPR-associated protein Cse2/CasB [Desulfobacteraceae bacterium]|nr:type I-E CRISPR-associated protein Cse2/CasB [Desulfobacteraceae bacterium]
MEPATPARSETRGESFAAHIIQRLPADSAYGAALRRADNPATEYQAWEHLVHWCDLEKSGERIPFSTIAAALARAKPKQDGHLGIGRAVAACYDRGADSDAAKNKLRRILSCNSAEEACRVLRGVLRLIQSRAAPICYGHLLDQLLYFGERQKVRWATDFYGRRTDHDSNDA